MSYKYHQLVTVFKDCVVLCCCLYRGCVCVGHGMDVQKQKKTFNLYYILRCSIISCEKGHCLSGPSNSPSNLI